MTQTGLDTSLDHIDDEARIARRNVFLLAFAQATHYGIAPLAMAVGGLAGHYLLGADKSLATLPITAFVLGPLFGSMPAAMLMRQIGRRFGFMTGAAFGFIGSGGACYAILINSFPLLCLSMMMMGVSVGFAQQYRFAAADYGSAAFRTKAISWVLAGGLAAAVIGPQMALFFADTFEPIQFAGSFVGGMVLSAIGFIALFFLKVPASTEVRKDETADTSPARPLAEIARQPLFMIAVICGAASYMMMSLVMTAAPIAMLACGFSTEMSTLGIQWHVMAMFGPSFFTGNLIVRFGHAKIIGAGMLLYVICGAIALAGIELIHFWSALIALGIAWNFAFIGTTSLVTKCYQPSEKNKVQGLFDTIIFALVGGTSLMSGVLMSAYGWTVVVGVMAPLILLCTVTLALSRRRLRAVTA
ncbi:MAG: MFS transporter [Pseudomonadota bacterium]